MLRRSCVSGYREEVVDKVVAVGLAGFASSFEVVQGERLNRAPAAVVQSVASRGAAEIRRYSKGTAYLIGADLADDLVEKASEHDEFIRDFLACRPYLRAAVTAGVDPLEALEVLLDIEPAGHLAVRWQGLAELMTRTPVALVAGEDGTPIARGRLSGVAAPGGGGDDDDYSSFED
jgi:hypothetical protein